MDDETKVHADNPFMDKLKTLDDFKPNQQLIDEALEPLKTAAHKLPDQISGNTK